MESSRQRVVRDGLVSGVIGAGLVAAWFLVADVVAGRPFFTPALLGSAIFSGLRDSADVVVGLQPVVAYTVAHVLAFVVVGTIASWLIADAEKNPGVLWLLVEFAIGLEFGFYATVILVSSSLLAELAWLNVAVANLIAGGGMGYYFWKARPVLRGGLHQSPIEHVS